VFVGRAAEADEARLKALAERLRIGDRVHFAGFRFPVEPVLKGLDVLMAPSQTEGFGRALVESMLAGTPVVSSPIAAHREIIDRPSIGLIADPGDAETFADLIAQLADDEARRRQIGQEAVRSAEARFGCTEHVERMRAIYDRLIDGRRRSGAV
jgi:glycosyltransferase involved in cell wall biosynthesis